MSISLTYLRSHLYTIIDDALASGVPIEIERHGQRLKIIPMTNHDKLARLKAHKNVVVGDSEELVHFDWSTYWSEDRNL